MYEVIQAWEFYSFPQMNCIWPLFCTRIAHHLRLSFSREIFSLKETEQWTTSCAWEPLSLADNNVNKLFYWFAITKNIRYFCSLFRPRKTALSLWLKDLSFSIQREMFFFFFFIYFFAVSSIRLAHFSFPTWVNMPSSTDTFSLFHRELDLILEGRFSFLKNVDGKQKQQW